MNLVTMGFLFVVANFGLLGYVGYYFITDVQYNPEIGFNVMDLYYVLILVHILDGIVFGISLALPKFGGAYNDGLTKTTGITNIVFHVIFMISFNVFFFFLWFLNISGRSRPFSEYWKRTTYNQIIMFIEFNLFFVYGITMTAQCLRRFKGRNNNGLSAYVTLIPNELN